jgi:hypothetical protein
MNILGPSFVLVGGARYKPLFMLDSDFEKNFSETVNLSCPEPFESIRFKSKFGENLRNSRSFREPFEYIRFKSDFEHTFSERVIRSYREPFESVRFKSDYEQNFSETVNRSYPKPFESSSEVRYPAVLACNYYVFFLWRCDPTRVMASSFLRFLYHTQRRTTFGRTPLES